MQTDSYLEQLTDSVAEAEMSTQTDPFKDRPSTPLFIPAKAGLDATTQIEAGDLFDFDFEVQTRHPPLCILVFLLTSYQTVTMLHFDKCRNFCLARMLCMGVLAKEGYCKLSLKASTHPAPVLACTSILHMLCHRIFASSAKSVWLPATPLCIEQSFAQHPTTQECMKVSP